MRKKLKVKLAIFSDVHSNWEAWQAVKSDIIAEKVDQTFCLGDVVGYGPNPQECFTDIKNFAHFILKGNHEASVLNAEEESYLNWVARTGVQYSRKHLDADSINAIHSLEPQMQSVYGIICCHGAITEDYKYIINPEDTVDEFKAMAAFTNIPTRICFVGHTHNPFVFGEETGLFGGVHDNMKLRSNQRYIINVGSVGQPRDGDCRASYVILAFDLKPSGGIENITFNLKRIFYNIQVTADKILAAGLPTRLAERLFVGE